ncbi:MAG: lactoylglutathione lyase [Alteromonadaceae bacterium]|nr:lactoylglutathione lyase [Alteromonadaceae bacterium]
MEVANVKAFVPSKDYEISKSFYNEIGFTAEFVSKDLTLFHNGESLFFLQNFYNKELAENFMLQICVTDIQQAFEICSEAQHKTKITPVQHERWGKVFYLWGPSGELLHITELAAKEQF